MYTGFRDISAQKLDSISAEGALFDSKLLLRLSIKVDGDVKVVEVLFKLLRKYNDVIQIVSNKQQVSQKIFDHLLDDACSVDQLNGHHFEAQRAE